MSGLGKDAVTWLQVGDESAGQRIDNFLLKMCKGVPHSHVYRILRSGEVRVNKGRVKADYRLQLGDQVRVPPVRVAQREQGGVNAAAPAREFPVVFEDDAVLVIDKPAGVAVHGGSGVSFGVIEQLRRARPQAKFLELAHRLDRETSGLLIVGKKRSALVRLQDDFREGSMGKRYFALVKGRWLNQTQHIRNPLYKYLIENGERRVRVDPEGKPAHSIVRLVRRWQTGQGYFSLVEVELKTGRTHQIRVHLTNAGFPLLGDDKYGDFALNKELQRLGLKRMFLHAARLEMTHPATGEVMSLEAPLPPELSEFLRRLDIHDKKDYGEAV
ncbi:MAG: RluA family pseudouridine synthase [Rhodocyclaceae bacterium]|nr:RluA family pseudouridine synthase [Rhodocyclaceae bacterium]